MARILVTGANGFIGRRLIASLLAEKHDVWALVRIRGTTLFPTELANLKIIYGDLSESNALAEVPKDLEIAYYLMHSMSDIVNDFTEMERTVAENFIKGLQETSTRQIIYLGGIINGKNLSKHLNARLMVEDMLKESGIPTTILRASIIVGSGSASFEIIRDLVEKLPFMVAPRWINSRCQPIAIRDVLFYLKSVIDNPESQNHTFEIGGPEILTFKQVLLQFAEFRQLQRYIIVVPVLTPRLSSYWLVFVTSVRFSLAYYLVESMKSDTYCHDNTIHALFNHTCLTYKEAIEKAFLDISLNEVPSTWMDSWDISQKDFDMQKYIEVPKHGVLQDIQRVRITGDVNQAVDNLWRIGGKTGWYTMNWAWDLRGLMDKFAGGVGMNRGRRSPNEILPGDSIDFWRVLKADKKSGSLILFAQMKVPGEAWLEFKIDPSDPAPQLIQTATFRPRGLLGRAYWYCMFPFHYFIFRKMAYAIANGKPTNLQGPIGKAP